LIRVCPHQPGFKQPAKWCLEALGNVFEAVGQRTEEWVTDRLPSN